jgi:dynein heavy chain
MKNFLSEGQENSHARKAGEKAPIPLEKFEHEIRKFENIHKTVMALESEVNFSGWLRVDLKPLKQGLNVVIKKWSYSFTKYLSDETVDILNEFNRFIKDSKNGLLAKVSEGDYDGLVKSMGLLQAVKTRSNTADAVFESLRKTMNLLKQFNVDLPDDTMKLLNDLPEEWSELTKLASSAKDTVAPLQSTEVDSLQKKANRFEMKNHVFREEFKRKAPFRFEIGPIKSYDQLDQVQNEVVAMENELAALKKSSDLFELSLPAYKQLADCRREIGMLKSIWDMVGFVIYLFDSWKSTLWTAIDIDAMDMKCRDLNKELRKLDKEMKAWDVYIGLDQTVSSNYLIKLSSAYWLG